MKARLLAGAVAALCLFVLACGDARKSTDPSAAGLGGSGTIADTADTAVIALSGDLSGVNPLISTNAVTRSVLDHVFMRLFAEQADYSTGPPRFEPRLAESWTWSEDGLSLTLALRRDASWSDGVPLTAADVVWSLDAASDPDIAWVYSDTHERIAGYRALDDHTVEVRFRSAYPDRLSDLNENPIMPRHAWGEIPFAEWGQSGGWFRSNLVASGPFLITEWRANSQIELKRNPRYHREGYPQLDRIVLLVVPARVNRLEMLLAGEVDFVTGLGPSVAARVAASEAVELSSFWSRQYHFIVWNGCRPPFDDPIVRRAMTLALDRESLAEAVYGEFGRVAVSPMLSDSWVFADDLEPWPWDPEEAKRLLAARGFVDADGDGVLERDGEPLIVRVSTNRDNEMRTDMATMIHAQLREIGVAAELSLVEFSVFSNQLTSHDFEAGLASWTVDTAFDLKDTLHSSSIESSQNFGCYRSAAVDRLIDLAREQTDLAELERLLGDLQRQVHEDQPYTFLVEVQRLNGRSRRLRGAEPNAIDPFGRLEEWWIASGN